MHLGLAGVGHVRLRLDWLQSGFGDILPNEFNRCHRLHSKNYWFNMDADSAFLTLYILQTLSDNVYETFESLTVFILRSFSSVAESINSP